ncbi:hypothetical protein UXP84_15195 [Enterobacter hormaechei]
MMVINCSASAAQHLYKNYKKNQNEGFFESAATVTDTVMQRQSHIDGRGGIQWVVQAVKLGRSTNLIAMEVSTRWVHVIHKVPKGDVEGFVTRLNQRLVNGVEWLGQDLSLFTTKQMEKSIECYFTLNKDLLFYQQTDTSVMAHISQVAAFYSDVYHDIGDYPDDEETALEFDLRLNEQWRCKKGEKFNLRADEKMLTFWCERYMKKDTRWISAMLEKIRAHTKLLLKEKLGVLSELRHEVFSESASKNDTLSQQHKVISLDSFRKRAKK